MTNKHIIHAKDPQYQQAKKNGYRARSAYKLLDIQTRYNIFKRAFYILDLGCAPGSWLQVTKKIAEDNLNKYNDQYYHRDHYKILGIDIKKVSQIENVKLLKMDFTNPEFHNELESYLQTKIDLILSDAAINKSGIKFSDHLKQGGRNDEKIRIVFMSGVIPMLLLGNGLVGIVWFRMKKK